MKVTNGEVWQASSAVDELVRVVWPVKTAWRLARLARKLRTYRQDIDQVRVALIARYGQANERGQTTVNEGCPGWAEFVPLLNELMAQQVLTDCEPVALPSLENLGIKPETLLAMGPFVEEEEEGPGA